MRGVWMFAAGAILVASATSARASGGTGTVNVVNINTTWRGVMVQLTNNPSTFETQCPSTWVYMSVDDPLFRPTVAALLAAKIAVSQVITIYTKGCVQAPLGILPQIDSIDYGTRTGG
jgi:hypothetical protein